MSSRFSILCCSTAFLPADSHGGLPYSTFNLCRALIRAGADVRVVATDRNGSGRLDVATDCWTTYQDVPVWYARTSPGPFLASRAAARAIDEGAAGADAIINSGTLWVHSGWVAWRAARRYRKPALSYVRGLLDPWAFQFKALRKQTYWRLIAKRILQDSAAVVALSETERKTLRDLNITARIEVIPNGATIDAGDPSASLDRAALDACYPPLAGNKYVLFLGRIHEKKGIDVLLPAIAEILRQADGVAFVIAGPIDPGYQSRWDGLVRAHGLDGKLVLPGAVSGNLKAALLRHADLFVLPSYSEGLPVAVLEALVAGCPVIVSKACNLPEVQQADAGIVIDPDVPQLVQATLALLGDEPRRRRMAGHASELALKEFNWDAIGARTLALCRELAGVR